MLLARRVEEWRVGTAQDARGGVLCSWHLSLCCPRRAPRPPSRVLTRPVLPCSLSRLPKPRGWAETDRILPRISHCSTPAPRARLSPCPKGPCSRACDVRARMCGRWDVSENAPAALCCVHATRPPCRRCFCARVLTYLMPRAVGEQTTRGGLQLRRSHGHARKIAQAPFPRRSQGVNAVVPGCGMCRLYTPKS